MFATFFLGALYLQGVLGYDPLETGLAFLPMTLIVAFLSLGITARLMSRFGALRVVTFGLTVSAAGLLLLTRAGEGTAYFPTIAVAYAAVGIGAGTSFMPLLTLALGEVPKADAGLASGMVNVSVQIGGALGLAVLGAVATHRTLTLTDAGEPHVSALVGGYHLAYAIGAGCILAALLVSRLLRHSPGARLEPVRSGDQAASADGGAS
jgi:MFS family permease